MAGSTGSGNLIPPVEPTGAQPLVTTEAPHPYGNVAGAIEGAYGATARGLKEAGSGLMDLATPIAEAQAASDLQNQKVTTGPDGKIQILNPARSLIFGKAGEAYGATVTQGTVAQVGNVVDSALTDIHAKHLYDPAGEKTAAQAYLTGLRGLTGNPIADQAIQQRAQQQFTEHNDNNLEATARLRLANDVDALKATKDASIENMATIAQSGVGLDTPGPAGDKLRAEWGRYSASQDALAKAPGVKYPQELRDLDDTHVKNRLVAEASMGQIDKFMSGELPGGLPAAKGVVAKIEQMQGIDRVEKRILLQDANSRIASNFADLEARKQENRQANALWEEGMTKGGLGRDALPLIAGAIQRTKDLGDAEEAKKLQHLYDGWRAAAPTESLSEPDRQKLLYGNEPSINARAPTQASVAPEAISRAILGQESGGNPNVGTSVDNAHGIGQIIPATFAQYTKPGERIDNPADNLAVHQRIITDYTQRWPNDPARVAVAYFSGPDNVSAPGSATPYKSDSRDGNGKSVSSYVNDVMGRLGKGGGAPSDGRWTYKVTAADVAKNPDLASDYLKQTLLAPENRYESAKTIVDTIERGAEHGWTDVPTDAAAEVRQYLDAHPDDVKAKELGSRFDAAMATIGSAGGGGGGGIPAGERSAQITQAAATSPDIFQRDALGRWSDLERKRSENIAKAPYDYAANPGARVLARPVTPIDPTKPESLIPAIMDRAQAGQVISQKMGIPTPAILAQPPDKAAFQQIMQGPKAGAVAVLMAQSLPPDALMRMSDEPAFVTAINAMRNSGDYGKASSAFATMEAMNNQNSPEFDLKFKDGLKDLSWWQSVGSGLAPDQFAKKQAERHDPGYEEKMRPFNEAANKYMTDNNIDVNAITNRLGSSWFSTAPAPGGVPSDANAQILYDWSNALHEGMRDGMDANSAAAYADKTTQNKWTRSDANGGRLTAYAPEVFTKNPDGSPAFAGAPAGAADKIIDNEIRTTLGLPPGLQRGQHNVNDLFGGADKMTGDDVDRLNEFYGPRILQGDAQTKADIASHKAPSYAIYLQDKSGRWFTPTDHNGQGMRVFFDPQELKQMEVGQARSAQPTAPAGSDFNPLAAGAQ